ncbi:MAG: IS630 family transposase, partial [Thermoplasmata archaeon]
VHRWAVRRRDKGPHSWKELPRPGRPSRLTEAQRRKLQQILVVGARTRGYPTDLWTLKRVAEVIRKEYGFRYSLPGVWSVLRDLGFSAQVPMRRALERNEEYIHHWVRTTWPEIFRQALETHATLVFVDESGVQTTPNVRRSWALEGSRPVLHCLGGREKLSIISGVTLEGELYFEVHRHDLSGTEVIWFLEQLLEEIPGRVIVVWDNIGIHRSAEVSTFLWMHQGRLETRRIPPYAPELNPDEGVWDVLKNDRLANYCPSSLDELETTVRTELEALRANPDRIQAAIRQTELPIHTVEQFVRAGGPIVTSSI